MDTKAPNLIKQQDKSTLKKQQLSRGPKTISKVPSKEIWVPKKLVQAQADRWQIWILKTNKQHTQNDYMTPTPKVKQIWRPKQKISPTKGAETIHRVWKVISKD